MSEQLKQLEKLAREVTSETLHGSLPLKTSMQLASDVLTACDLARTARSDLARKVLADIERPIECLDKDHDDRWCPTCNAQSDAQDMIADRVRNLCTDEGITLGDENELSKSGGNNYPLTEGRGMV